jgi:hypothetical protein
MRMNYRLYPAGLISIVFLPLLCIWHLNRQKTFEKTGAMDVAYYYHTSDIVQVNWFKTVPSFRKYTEIKFSGNAGEDSLRLQYARMEVRRIFNSKDSINGVHIKFTSATKYWSFVKAIEICHNENAFSLLDNNDMWIYYASPLITEKNTDVQSFNCGTGLNRTNLMLTEELKAENEKYYQERIKFYLVPLILWLAMFYFSLNQGLTFHRFARTSKISSF